MAEKAKAITMDELLASEDIKPIVLGDTIEGTVMSVKKHEILIDLGAQGVGLVPRREASFARNLKEGDEVFLAACTAGSDDRYIHRIGYRFQHLQIKAFLDAIRIDGV